MKIRFIHIYFHVLLIDSLFLFYRRSTNQAPQVLFHMIPTLRCLNHRRIPQWSLHVWGVVFIFQHVTQTFCRPKMACNMSPLHLHTSPSFSPEPSDSEHTRLVEHRTQPNTMSLFCIYPTWPTLIPTGNGDIHSVVDAPTLDGSESQQSHRDHQPRSAAVHGLMESEITSENLFAAFSSPTAGLLMCWQYTGSNAKSAGELNRLWSFIKDPRFDPLVVDSFSHEREKKLVEKYLHTTSNPFNVNHGWKISSVLIKLPHERSQWSLGEDDPSVRLGVYIIVT